MSEYFFKKGEWQRQQRFLNYIKNAKGIKNFDELKELLGINIREYTRNENTKVAWRQLKVDEMLMIKNKVPKIYDDFFRSEEASNFPVKNLEWIMDSAFDNFLKIYNSTFPYLSEEKKKELHKNLLLLMKKHKKPRKAKEN